MSMAEHDFGLLKFRIGDEEEMLKVELTIFGNSKNLNAYICPYCSQINYLNSGCATHHIGIMPVGRVMNLDGQGFKKLKNEEDLVIRVSREEKNIMQNIRKNNGWTCLGAVKGLENDGYGQAVLSWCNGAIHLEGYDLQSSSDCVDYLNGELQSNYSINQYDCDCNIVNDENRLVLLLKNGLQKCPNCKAQLQFFFREDNDTKYASCPNKCFISCGF